MNDSSSPWDEEAGFPAEPLPRVPDAIEPITAYRMWTVRWTFHVRLFSIGRRHEWRSNGPVHAVCAAGVRSPFGTPHTAPAEGCTCGIYAVKNIDALFRLNRSLTDLIAADPPLPIPPYVIGEVQLSGKVIEHDEGYRAERARITAIFHPPGQRHRVEPICEAFGVPARPVPSGTWPRAKAPARWRRSKIAFRLVRAPRGRRAKPVSSLLLIAWLIARLVTSLHPAVSPTPPIPTPSPTGMEAFAPGITHEWNCLRGANTC